MQAVHTQRTSADFGADQAKMVRAADYPDEWFAADGRSFRAYYICLAGGAGTECGTMMRNDVWMRLHPDMLATKHRWYCTGANAVRKRRASGAHAAPTAMQWPGPPGSSAPSMRRLRPCGAWPPVGTCGPRPPGAPTQGRSPLAPGGRPPHRGRAPAPAAPLRPLPPPSALAAARCHARARPPEATHVSWHARAVPHDGDADQAGPRGVRHRTWCLAPSPTPPWQPAAAALSRRDAEGGPLARANFDCIASEFELWGHRGSHAELRAHPRHALGHLEVSAGEGDRGLLLQGGCGGRHRRVHAHLTRARLASLVYWTFGASTQEIIPAMPFARG